MAAAVIEQPQIANNPDAQQLAGVRGGLKAYQSILADNTSAKSAALDRLLEMQGRGELPSFVHKAFIQCSKDGLSEQLHLP